MLILKCCKRKTLCSLKSTIERRPNFIKRMGATTLDKDNLISTLLHNPCHKLTALLKFTEKNCMCLVRRNGNSHVAAATTILYQQHKSSGQGERTEYLYYSLSTTTRALESPAGGPGAGTTASSSATAVATVSAAGATSTSAFFGPC